MLLQNLLTVTEQLLETTQDLRDLQQEAHLSGKKLCCLENRLDEWCNLPADRERHTSHTMTFKEWLGEKAAKVCHKCRQAGPPFSWLVLCH